MSEFVVAGLLITPFVKYAIIALLVCLPIHMILARLGIEKWAFHPLLAEAGIYICVLAFLNIFL
jgi:hypothetical protein